jgi:chemotaxis protein MotC
VKVKLAMVFVLVLLVVGSACVVYILWKPANPTYMNAQNEPVLAQGADPGNLASSSGGTILEGPRDCVVLVRNLGNIQDRIISGAPEAVSQQYNTISEINKRLKELPLKTWRNKSKVQCLLNYVLSGGNSEVLKTVITTDVLSPDDKELAEGVYYFSVGQREKALGLLGKIDPRSLGRYLAGPVALAQASLLEVQDPKKALTLLDEVRLQAPHTALEEASIRRQIPLLVKQTELDRALPLAVLYFRRYGASLYAEALQESFVIQLTAQTQSKDAIAAEVLLSEFESLDSSRMSNLFLAIARQSLLSGNVTLAKSAANTVLTKGLQQDVTKNRALLYAAAADAVSSEAAAALVILGSLSSDQLTVEESQLRDGAISVARKVIGKDLQSGAEAAVTTGSKDPGQSQSVSLGNEPALRAVISQADNLIKKADEFGLGENR